jgi:probable phosphoglycerate mutase
MIKRYVYLARHGEPAFSDQARRYLGQKNPPLSGVGIRQAKALHQKLKPLSPEAIYGSDLLRCVQTADEIALGICKPIYLPGLREIDMGEWDGQNMEDIKAAYPLEYQKRGEDFSHYKPPGGESFQECATRVKAVWDQIIAAHRGDLVIVAHAGVNRTLLCWVLGMDLAHLFKLGQSYGCVNTLMEKNGFWSVQHMNETPFCEP